MTAPTEDWDPNGRLHVEGVDDRTQARRRRVSLTPASAIRVRPVRWLWDARVALGTLALVAGREGIGKSMVAYQVAADITRGRLPGVNFGAPRAVLICATEDSWEHTIVPRLMAADANLDLVFRIDVTTSEGTDGTLTLPADNAALEAAVAEVDAAAIILDPLMSRLSSSLDTHKDAEVRTALEPLVAVADRTGAALFGLIHVNKSTSTDPLTMLMGSRAFAAVARSVLFVAVDPEDETQRRRFLGQPKNNLGSSDIPMRTFTIEPTKVADTDEGEVWTGRVAWQGDDARTIDQVLQTASEPRSDRTEKDEAAGWLADYLTIHHVALSETVKAAAKEYGHKDRTLARAREKLGAGVTSYGFPRRTWWSQPGMTPDEVTNWLNIYAGDNDNAQSCQTPGETHIHGMTGSTEEQTSTSTPVVPVVPTPESPDTNGTTSQHDNLGTAA